MPAAGFDPVVGRSRPVERAAAGIAKILFFVFIVLFVVSLIFGRRPVV
jgi:uncharacterized membrane protein YtjA (UPF0391 family)